MLWTRPQQKARSGSAGHDVTELTVPEPGQAAAEAFVKAHLAHLVVGPIRGSTAFRGGQKAANAALVHFDLTGYATRRNEVYPATRRGASRLSPYIRHGLLSLPDVWAATAHGPTPDVNKFHDELLWQEFARHWYARLGHRTARGVRRVQSPKQSVGPAWDRSMACIDVSIDELESDGWLVNQARMWLASQWAVRSGSSWSEGEDVFFRHLLDGSRAANRLGWQWTSGVGSSKHYGFSRWQVNKRAPGLCDRCGHREACPIEQWPDDPMFGPPEQSAQPMDGDPTQIAGPQHELRNREPDTVWLTAESLGDSDPALMAYPDLPAVFVFDEPLLQRLQLSAKRLVFLTETLAEIATQTQLTILVGDPVAMLGEGRSTDQAAGNSHGEHLAVTFAPVPGFRSRAEAIRPAAVLPWPWLVQPAPGSVSSFSAWRKSVVR